MKGNTQLKKLFNQLGWDNSTENRNGNDAWQAWCLLKVEKQSRLTGRKTS